MRAINIGLTEEQRQGVANLLNQDLADAYLLLVKTKKYHWDVVGPQFRSLHELWEEHYEKLTVNIDALAERVRALGCYPVGTMQAFLDIATLKEHSGDVPTATGMVTNLVEDHEQIIRNLRDHVDQSSDEFHDEGTADFLTGLMEEHEEMAWMLRSFIEGQELHPDGSRPETGTKTPVGV
ncbi:DNA starvation/stationary phase protection protein [Nostoc sp. MBR 210]|uniref:DNA starvation/stationary phase protection protein n=1 Tax=Nostoc spongiaeforme FACHB-130 TaxID=1357510 RepID=A0ABR8G0P0_9NOSO|nr:Dps family protein [Nostoc spongiaeforme]MBD2596791.1 DNA starvation/stationary phase protection protein [Nostoc spongiaeforme FACHB-130]OCQ97184.1 DNA starvation/stationary phase protection protein [Nostoc sp. MBR 210]